MWYGCSCWQSSVMTMQPDARLLTYLLTAGTTGHCWPEDRSANEREVSSANQQHLHTQPQSTAAATNDLHPGCGTGCVSEKTTKLLLHPFNDLFSRTTWVSWYQKSKTSLDLNEARDNGVLGCSGISWTTCKQYASRSRQITTPTPHHSISTG